MSPTEMLARVRRQPFEPFRIVTSEGTTYDIRHRNVVWLTVNSIFVGYPVENPRPGEDGVWSHYDIIPLSQIVRLEDLTPAQRS